MDADADTIRRALAGLLTDGLLPWNVLENGGRLLDLEMVRSRVDLDEDASEAEHAEAYARALVSVLSEAVTSDEVGGKSRRLLNDVLPLNAEYLGAPVKERRTAAGAHLKPGKKAISPGTIRTYYEPKALDKLAEVLVQMEFAFRARAES
jgi:hypothetical protein